MQFISFFSVLQLAYGFQYIVEYAPSPPVLDNRFTVPGMGEIYPEGGPVTIVEEPVNFNAKSVPNREHTNAHDEKLASSGKESSAIGEKQFKGAQCGLRGGYYHSRIVGGFVTAPGEFPWQVSIQASDQFSLQHICGGAIVDRHWVLTAAHCTTQYPPSELYVVGGKHNLFIREGTEERKRVAKIVRANFDEATFTNDIALLKVDTPFNIESSPNVSTVCLPKSGQIFAGLGTVTGWGRLSEGGAPSNTLRQVTIPLISKNTCWSKYNIVGYSGFLNTCSLCTLSEEEGKDACQGDSGGPLICQAESEQYFICGVVSWGLGCARPGYPGVYTEVACFADWIRHVINTN